MENYRYKNVEEIKSEEDNFEILKCQRIGKPLYKNVQWSLLCDKSGSMHGDRITCLLQTLIDMFKYFINDSIEKNNHHYVHIIAFDDRIENLHLDIDKTTVIESLSEQVKKVLIPRGMTNIGKALNTFKNTKYEKEVSMHNIIFMSDGQVTDGIYDKDILKSKLQEKINNIMHGAPAIIGYGTGHDIDCMEKLASVTNGEYHCVESTEGASVVYGEVLHSCLNEYCRNAELIIKDGLVYDFKANKWVEKLYLGRMIVDKPMTWSVKRKELDKPLSAKIIGENCEGIKKELLINLVEEPIKGEVNDEVERYKLRYLTQKLLAEARKIIEKPPEEVIPYAARMPASLLRQNAVSITIPTPVTPPQRQLLSGPPPLKRKRKNSGSRRTLYQDSDDEGASSNDISVNIDSSERKEQKSEKDIMIEKLEAHLKMLKQYIEDNGDNEGFVAVLTDDTYIAIRSLRASNGRHFLVARQVSQGNQRAYMASDMSDMCDDMSFLPPPTHNILRCKTTPYASQKVVNTIRQVSGPAALSQSDN